MKFLRVRFQLAPFVRALVPIAALTGAAVTASAVPTASLVPVTTVNNPLYVTHAGDDRLFIGERGGRILIYTESQGVLPIPFLDITSLVDDSLDGGFFTFAFHPEYATNGFFFVSYTETGAPLRSVIARYRVSATDPNVADPASAKVLIRLDQPNGSHNNDQVEFGPLDGNLYVSFGDGGGGGGPGCRSQLDNVFFGKLLRLDVDQSIDTEPFYGIPPSNPFADPSDGILDEIWAKGFRNPWRFSFDRTTGDIYIADVGQDTREEVDLQPGSSTGGENYGWKVMEGTTCFDPDPIDPSCPAGTPSCFDSSYTPPIFEYPTGGDCSIIGGYVYRGESTLAQGLYYFGDFCSGRIWALEETSPGHWTRSELLLAGFGLTSFGLGWDGEIYVTLGNDVYRLAFDGPTLPRVCGDGVIVDPEQCDDGNLVNGDCCDDTCMFESGPGTPECCLNGVCQVGAQCGTLCVENLVCTDAGGLCLCALP